MHAEGIMRRGLVIGLCTLGAIIISAASAALGFYKGMEAGMVAAGAMVRQSMATHALSQVRFSMVALGRSELNLSQQESELGLQEALINLGGLSKAYVFVQCTDQDKRALADAGIYMKAHPDSTSSSPSTYWEKGIKFCDFQHIDPNVTVSYMTTGK
jgi:hypothetical protein